MKKTLANFIRVLLSFLILASAAMCIWWLEKPIDYILYCYIASGAAESADVLLHIVCAIVIAPIFAIFVMAFAFPRAIENDTLFSGKTAKLLKVIGVLLLADCAVFCGIFLVLLLLGESFLSPVLIFVGALGITVGCMLLVLSKYVRHAAALKEEADGIL